MNKNEFMEKLRASLNEYGVTDTRDILLDFEQHFEDGLAAGETEAEVCEKLGDPNEIAKQYIPEIDIAVKDRVESAKTETVSDGFDTHNYKTTPPPAPIAQQSSGFQPDAGKIIGIILLDMLVLTWALPTLISLVGSLYGITGACGGAGIAVFFGGILMQFIDMSGWLFTTLSPLSTALFGVVLMAATPLLVVASIAATKGIINLIKHIINMHSEAIVGRKVCKIVKKGEEN